MNENCYCFKLGEFECVVLQDGTKNQPTQAINEEIPQEELSRVLREHGLPTDEVAFGYNCLLVKAGMDNILIDTGYGWYSEEGGQLVSSLTEAGITTTDIDIIIFTHADGDHVGGTLDPEGKEIYPNARYVLPSVSWEYWTSQANLSQIPEGAHNFGKEILPRIKDKVEIVELDVPFRGGFRFLPYPAHRLDHVILQINSGQEGLLHLADAVIHPLHLEYPGWKCPYDSRPELAYRDRKRLLEMAVGQESMVFVSHFPFPGLGHIGQVGETWRWQPVEEG